VLDAAGEPPALRNAESDIAALAAPEAHPSRP
jgi:hypothetical protein